MLKITEPATLKRVRRLEQEHIQKYDGIINWDKMPFRKVWYFANLIDVKKIIDQKPVLGFLETAGYYKHAFACFFRNLKDKRKFESLLPKEKIILDINSFHSKPISLFDVSHNIEKDRMTEEEEKITKKDIKILECVCEGGGRLSLWDISKKIGLTYEIVRYRFKKLVSAGYFSRFIAQPNSTKFGITTIYVHLQFKRKVPIEKLERIKQTLGYLICEDNNVLVPIFTNSFHNYVDEISSILDQFRDELKKVDFYPIKNALLLNRYPFEYLLRKTARAK